MKTTNKQQTKEVVKANNTNTTKKENALTKVINQLKAKEEPKKEQPKKEEPKKVMQTTNSPKEQPKKVMQTTNNPKEAEHYGIAKGDVVQFLAKDSSMVKGYVIRRRIVKKTGKSRTIMFLMDKDGKVSKKKQSVYTAVVTFVEKHPLIITQTNNKPKEEVKQQPKEEVKVTNKAK